LGYKTSEINFVDDKPTGFKTSELKFVEPVNDHYEALSKFNKVQQGEDSNWGIFSDSAEPYRKAEESRTREEKIKADTGMMSFTSLNPLEKEFIGNEPAFLF
jgi:hypothetical protein